MAGFTNSRFVSLSKSLTLTADRTKQNAFRVGLSSSAPSSKMKSSFTTVRYPNRGWRTFAIADAYYGAVCAPSEKEIAAGPSTTYRSVISIFVCLRIVGRTTSLFRRFYFPNGELFNRSYCVWSRCARVV